jgi:stage II sporulation protein D
MPRWPTRAPEGVRPRLRLIAGAALLAIAVGACARTLSTGRAPRTVGSAGGDVAVARNRSARDASLRTVRVALAPRSPRVTLGSSGDWTLVAADGETVVGSPRARESWVLESIAGQISLHVEGAEAVPARGTTFIARPAAEGGAIAFNGRRWRGELAISAGEGGLLVVNRVRMDDYVKGVVPLEIGTSAAADEAAIEAQAVTARSYAYMHLLGPGRPYDMVATVQDQVYGGIDAETTSGNLAVDATSGLVLLYDGHVVNAPYSANCGGSTAGPGDAWRTGPEPYLQRVSDAIPGTTRSYCDWAPKYRWTRSYTGEELRQSIARYVRSQPGGAADVERVRDIAVTGVTPAGRVAELTVDTERGRWVMRGNQIRSALRTASGEMLYSTYFSLDAAKGRSGVEAVTLRGGGYGHGVGMCQAGAIGRARAGQDFRTILGAYYPGTTVGLID